MPPGEQRDEVRPAEHEHRRGLGDAHAHGVPAAVEHPDLADDVAWPRTPDLKCAIPRHMQRSRDRAVDDEHHLARVVALAPQNLTRLHDPAAHDSCQLHQVRLVAALEERDGGQEVGGLAVRHRGRASRSRRRPA
jgi:hypothetical protein